VSKGRRNKSRSLRSIMRSASRMPSSLLTYLRCDEMSSSGGVWWSRRESPGEFSRDGLSSVISTGLFRHRRVCSTHSSLHRRGYSPCGSTPSRGVLESEQGSAGGGYCGHRHFETRRFYHHMQGRWNGSQIDRRFTLLHSATSLPGQGKETPLGMQATSCEKSNQLTRKSCLPFPTFAFTSR
jgi:hypothetical protein